jgi:hypothetical protein
VRSWSSDRLTVSTGTAKPTPEPSPVVVWIWELIPSTRPRLSSSGPPELPWLMAASVWIAPVVSKPVSDWIERPVALMTPTDSDCSSPNGLPMAATGEPTTRSLAEPSGSGRRVSPCGSTFRSATSENGSKPSTFAGTWLPSWKRTNTSRALRIAAPSPLVTTCAFVATSPSPEITKPEPSPLCAGPPGPASLCRPALITVTTPGDSRS